MLFSAGSYFARIFGLWKHRLPGKLRGIPWHFPFLLSVFNKLYILFTPKKGRTGPNPSFWKRKLFISNLLQGPSTLGVLIWKFLVFHVVIKTSKLIVLKAIILLLHICRNAWKTCWPNIFNVSSFCHRCTTILATCITEKLDKQNKNRLIWS